MMDPSGLRRARWVLALASLLAVSASGQETIDLPGATSATLAWAPADGPVSGYYVVVTRNGGSSAVQQITSAEQATVSADTGDELVVHVVAFDANGEPGPISPPSPTLRFLPTTTWGETPEGGDDPTTVEPTPDGEPAPEEPPPGDRAVPFDYTGDGRSDLVLSALGDLSLYVMEGAQVVAHEDLPELGDGWEVGAHGDYDGNGYADLLWRERDTGSLLVWLMQDGTVIDSATLDLGYLAQPADWSLVGSDDFDGDGRDDVLLHEPDGGEVELLTLHGTQVTATTPFQGYGRGWNVAALGDVDGDGAAEIVWMDGRDRRLLAWDLQGDQALPYTIGNTRSWRVMAAGDFDGDGRSDLFVQRRDPDRVAVWLLDGPEVVGVVPLPSASRDWSVFAAGDYDGNGLSDLAWYNQETAAGEIWFSDGASIVAEGIVDAGDEQASVLASDSSTACVGDFDGDGTISVADAWAVARCLHDPSGADCALADIDGDGALTDADFYQQRERVGWACTAEGF